MKSFLELKKEEIENSFVDNGWIRLAEIVNSPQGEISVLIFPNLIPTESVAVRKQQISANDFGLSRGFPYADRCDGRIRYYRFGDSEEEIEPVVYYRDQLGDGTKFPAYFELAEEFRLYFRLYEATDPEGKRVYRTCDDCGNELIVAEVTNTLVRVRVKFLKTFLAAKNKVLALNFDFSILWGEKTLASLGLNYSYKEFREEHLSFYYSCDDKSGITGELIRGQLFLFPPENVVLYGEDTSSYENFVLKEDADGNEVLASCNPDSLADFFGKNPNAHSYVTPVSFRREVLQKYYDNPQKYVVDDNVVCCPGFWSLRIDNGHHDRVVVMLGDLGRELPFEEQKYWRCFNIVPLTKPCFSPSTWKRNFDAEFCESSAVDIRLKERYEVFNERWASKFGWHLFKPLTNRDRHYFSSLRIMTSSDNQKEFNDQILALTKIFIDSLNEKELCRVIRGGIPKDTKGIGLLEVFLAESGFGAPEMIDFLKKLQLLRSSTVAHRASESKQGTKKALAYFNKWEVRL